jgi:hypothetical protein
MAGREQKGKAQAAIAESWTGNRRRRRIDVDVPYIGDGLVQVTAVPHLHVPELQFAGVGRYEVSNLW